jgi:hypothetical protein
MALKDEVREICNRLAPHGWNDLLSKHGLDITADNLEEELLRDLPSIKRNIDGFTDFAAEGKRGIEPGNPAQSLLFHAFASPNVISGANGQEELGAFPTLAEIEVIENYVYGIRPPSIEELKNRSKEVASWISDRNSQQGPPMAIVVFASEYRPAPETVHQKHADMCFSRAGVARVGTDEPLYDDRRRGFQPQVSNKSNAFRVLPAVYSAYIAIQLTGKKDVFGPMRFNSPEDKKSKFWVPLHKLFNGKDCIRNLDLSVTLQAFHVNQKIKRIHLHLEKIPTYPKTDPATLEKSPYTFTRGIAEFSTNTNFRTGVLIPVPHNPFVQEAKDHNGRVTFLVPPKKDPGRGGVFEYFSSSLRLGFNRGPREPDPRDSPEYVHIRHKVEHSSIINLNDSNDVIGKITEGNYKAQHYVDFTGDGWIEVSCQALESSSDLQKPPKAAYSLVTAPDFYPNVDQGELMEWYTNDLEELLRNPNWFKNNHNMLITLADGRDPPNLELKKSDNTRVFDSNDVTATAIISLPLKERKETNLEVPKTMRDAYLPDASSGYFAPGWDIGLDDAGDTPHLAAYTLGSPFPEDSKLCAALSAFWPAVAPDAGRSFWWKKRVIGAEVVNGVFPTITPLTDDEIGSIGNAGWDGSNGPKLISNNDQNETVEYFNIEYVDYVENALQNRFSLQLTGRVDIDEYEYRIKVMARAYIACGIDISKKSDQVQRLLAENPVLSFRKVQSGDTELKEAENQSGSQLSGQIFRIEIVNGQAMIADDDRKKMHLKVLNKFSCYVGEMNIVLIKHNDDGWVPKSTP